MKDDQTPFMCPKCGYQDRVFHAVCPECGRPFFRDYQDTQIHPRDPDPAGVYKGKFWAWIFLVLTVLGLAIWLPGSFGVI